jgi:leucyl aminopeptidase
MEFRAIVDAKARDPSGCAVVGVYENGDLGIGAQSIDAQIGGLIRQLQARGDFAAKLGDTLLLPQPEGAASARILLVGLGARSAFGRKQYRKALQSSVQALTKTGASDAGVYLAPDSRSEVRGEAKTAETLSGQRRGGQCAGGRCGGGRPEDRRRDRQRTCLLAGYGEPPAEHLHAHLYRAAR